MKTEDIKNIASAYMQVQEKAKMDKINPKELKKDFDDRGDKDIDNDGDTDSSDEYLHNRRKAVKKAMKKEASDTQMGTITVTTDAERKKRAQAYRDKQASMKKEEAELDEANPENKAKKRLYYGKKGADASNKNTASRKKHGKLYPGNADAVSIGRKMSTEEVELDEKAYVSSLSPKFGRKGSHDVISKDGKVVKSYPYSKAGMKAAQKHLEKMKEEVELDEAAGAKDAADNHGMDRGTRVSKKAWDKLKKTKGSNMSMKEKIQLQKESILEKEMTDAEKKKREDIVKGMKKNKEDLEKRYGSRWKDVMYATATKQAMESVDKALAMTKNLLTTKESFNTETTTWPVYKRIKEANDRAMHYKGAAPGDPKMMDKMTASDKAFIDAHSANDLDGIDSGIDGAKAAEDTAKNAAAQVKAGAGMNRTGDQKTGDKNIIKSTEAK